MASTPRCSRSDRSLPVSAKRRTLDRVTPRTCRAPTFWYTVLALNVMDTAEANSELRYAAPLLEQAARSARVSTTYAQRRSELARRALARV
jgi:hypothetical protein